MKIYFQGNTREEIASALVGFETLIIEDLTEESVEYMGCNIDITSDHYNPSAHTYKEWLPDLQVILQNELQRRVMLGKE